MNQNIMLINHDRIKTQCFLGGAGELNILHSISQNTSTYASQHITRVFQPLICLSNRIQRVILDMMQHCTATPCIMMVSSQVPFVPDFINCGSQKSPPPLTEMRIALFVPSKPNFHVLGWIFAHLSCLSHTSLAHFISTTVWEKTYVDIDLVQPSRKCIFYHLVCLFDSSYVLFAVYSGQPTRE